MKLIRKPTASDGWWEISPAEAQKLLETAAKNRPLRDFRAQTIGADITARRWRENGESVVFDDRGRLLDGQHRLRGCVLANMPIIVYCVHGVSSAAFASFDQGTPRGGSDLASLMDFENASTVAAAARLAIVYADGTLGKTGHGRLPQDVLKLYFKRHADELTASISRVVQHRNGIVKLIPLSHAALLYYLVNTAHRQEADEFLEKLATGTGLHKGDALLLFRHRMHELRGEKHRLSQVEKLALLIKTWNAFHSKKSVGVLRWRREVEPFPVIE